MITPLLLFNLVAILRLDYVRAVDSGGEQDSQKKTIAIIGGGISGSFAAKYLADYDNDCALDITIFSSPKGSPGDQGSRVSSLQLDDGRTVELGASIIFDGNELVNEMIDGDEELMKVKPHSSGAIEGEYIEVRTEKDGMGIYDGDSEKPFPLLVTNMTADEKKKAVIWRYNLDLWRINQATTNALQSFSSIYDLLKSMDKNSFFESPNDVWRAVGLSRPASMSFDAYLDEIGVSSSISWWRNLIGGQGVMRSELYTAMNICNNNQINSQMTGLAGLVNSAAATGNLFSIKGGNDNLISSAIRQAKSIHEKVCGTDFYGEGTIKEVQKRITTVVSDFENKMELFDDNGKLLGSFDIVILSAPLQFSGINFLGKGSMFDDSVLHSIPLNEMVDSENSNANDHQHKNAYGTHLPSSATRPYTQVVTTILSHATINTMYFSLKDELIPKAILFTEEGRRSTGISSIGHIHGDTYKIFSSEELSEEKVIELFGKEAIVEIIKVWGGKTGGATPAFNGGGESSYSTQFMLYDGGHGLGGFSESSSIYYTNAMEAAVSAIEISAIGSKSVSKLVARQLGLVQPTQYNSGDEL